MQFYFIIISSFIFFGCGGVGVTDTCKGEAGCCVWKKKVVGCCACEGEAGSCACETEEGSSACEEVVWCCGSGSSVDAVANLELNVADQEWETGESGVCLGDVCRSLDDVCKTGVEQCTCSVDRGNAIFVSTTQ